MKFLLVRTLRKDVLVQNMLLESKKIVLTLTIDNGEVVDEQVEEFFAALPESNLAFARIPALSDEGIDFAWFDLESKRNIKINVKEEVEIIPQLD